MILQGIENTPWSDLSGCYGTAENAPHLLNKLVFGTQTEQNKALYEINSNYFHQGSRYDGTLAIIPFLFKILEQNLYYAPHEIIETLLAFGRGLALLPEQYDIEWERTSYNSSGKQGMGSACFIAIKQKSVRFLHFATTEWDIKTRSAAAFAFVHFWDEKSADQTDLFVRLLDKESNVLHKSNLLLCLGIVGNNSLGVSFWSPFFTDENPNLIRLSAAIAQINLFSEKAQEEAINIVLQSLIEGWNFPEYPQKFSWWNGGDLLGYGAKTLPLLGAKYRRESISALHHSFENHSQDSESIVKSIIALSLPDPTLTAAKQLNTQDRAILKMLIESEKVSDYWLSHLLSPHDLSYPESTQIAKQIMAEIADTTL